jgi:DNA (cytosine-5)-methyltransferase 1
MTLTITDLFCGAGGSSSGAIQVPGVKVRMAANHWQLAIDTHNTNHPDADHDRADISQTDPRRYPHTDILWASPECFTAGHLVTTARGQIPIEDVVVGDLALTHLRRWRPVVRTQSRLANTVRVTGQGHTGIEVTPNHQFWLRQSRIVWSSRNFRRRQYGEAGWLAVNDAVSTQACWSSPVEVEPLETADAPAAFGLDQSAAWWLVGRWVGDGSLTFGRNHEVILTCSFAESDELAARLADTGARWVRRRMRTAEAFTLSDLKARDWLNEHFGHGASLKSLPAWSLSLSHTIRRALLDGYLSADGGVTQRRIRVSTVSRALAVSVRLLAESLGHRVAMAHDKRTTYRIEGRSGRAQLQWILHWEPSLVTHRSPEAFVEDGMAWSRIRSVKPGREQVRVYNIEVEEDHSYVLDGIVVANCTNHSVAKGRKRNVDNQPDLFGEHLPDEAAERSRSTMWDVVRFAEFHRYQAIIVENVVDVRDWIMWPAWSLAMTNLGYVFEVVYLNSMFAQAAGAPAPQSRDRLYVVAWRKGNRRPDLARWTSPLAYCPRCEKVAHAHQAWKRHDRQHGRYKAQYVWICGTSGQCGEEVFPGVLPAATAIDWTLAGERIGDRARPLAPKTIARIEAGLRRYARPIHLEAAGNTFERRPGVRTWPVDEPFKTMHTTASKAVACPPLMVPLRTHGTATSTDEPMKTFVAGNVGQALVDPMLVPAGGTWNNTARPVAEPFLAWTTRDTEALVVPVEGRDGKSARTAGEPLRTQTTRLQDAIVVLLRGTNASKPAETEPLDTVAANGNHHALVMRNMTARGDQGQMSTPLSEPLRTQTASSVQSLVRWDHLLVPYSRAGASRGVDEPMPTQTTIQGDALIGPEISVADCTFRMLEPAEIQLAMAFGSNYVVLGNKREQVRQLGNAVTPPAARDLIAAVAEALTGELIEVPA